MRRIVFVCVLLCVSAANASVIITHPFRGIEIEHRTETSPRKLSINVVKIDLTDPGISFLVTPSNGPATPGETTRQTTRDFLAVSHGQLAINTSFYDASSFPNTDNIGLAASLGDVYSAFQSNFVAMNISATNVATIERQAIGDLTGFATSSGVTPYNAFSGNEQIVTNSAITASDTALHPRTAAGITADQHLILFTVDGRQMASAGMKTTEIAAMLIADYGVVNAINLDGGGSTTLAIADPTARLLNIPVGILDIPGTERPNGQNLIVFAALIPEPGVLTILPMIVIVCRARLARVLPLAA